MLARSTKAPARVALGMILAASLSACGGSSQEGRAATVRFTLGSDASPGDARVASALAYLPAAVLVSLRDGDGDAILDLRQLAVHRFGSSFVSESLELEVGSYRLTGFLVVDASGNVVYAAPAEGADPALIDRVRQPLPIPFDVAAGVVHSQPVEVLPVDWQDPEQFGYAAFRFRINMWAKTSRRVNYALGEDGVPFTGDDVATGYNSVAFDANGDGSKDAWYALPDGAGADRIPFTQDDVPLGWWWSRAAELRGSGHVGPGLDGIWVSSHDPITGWQQYDYTYSGNTLYDLLYSSAGADGVWYTADDVISGYHAKDLDATGAELRRVRWGVGADLAPFTVDDEVVQDWFGAYVVNTYDGRSTKWDAWDRQVSYVEPGADGQWFTGDDVVAACRTHDFGDSTQYWTREVVSVPGEDGTCFTGDDRVTNYRLADNGYTSSEPTIVYPEVGVVDGSEDEAVFRPGQVLTYEVTMDQANWDFLEAHGILEEWMPATVIVRGGQGGPVDLGQVGFRHKGSYGTLLACWGSPTLDEDGDPTVETYAETLSRPRLDEPWCRKISYKLKFNEYVKATRFHGLKKLNLHAASRDPSMLREMLAYSTYFDFGVDAPRTSPARLFINGTFMGLFIAVEDVDDRYGAYHYPQAAGGSLYKEVWPNPVALSRFGAAGFAEYAASGQEEGDDPADFIALTSGAAAAVEQGSTGPISPLVDVDGLLRYMAVDRGIKNWDGVTALYTCSGPDCFAVGPHNYYWYRDTAADGRFHLIPWDLDNTFPWCDPYVEDCGYGAEHPVPNWNVKPADCSPVVVWGSSLVVPSGCDAFLNLLASTGWDRFAEHGRALAAGPLRADVLRVKAAKWAHLIEPIVAEDPVLDVNAWRRERDAFLDWVLPRAAGDLRWHLDQGYVVEPAP